MNIEEVNTDSMEIDSICDQLQNLKTCETVNVNLISDLNIIIREIANMNNLDVDIYDVCVSCGNNLIWDQLYSITQTDYKWLKIEGKRYFFETLDSFIKIDNMEKYSKVYNLYEKLLELFELQVE